MIKQEILMSRIDFPPAVRAAILTAADLNTGAENPEYLRGQVELICSLNGLDSDEYRDALTGAILATITRAERTS